MEEPPPPLRIVIVDGGPEAELLKEDLQAVAGIGEVHVVRRLGQAHALLKRGFNALCIDLFDPAVRPETGVAFIETVRREFPHVPICLFSKAEELESLPGVDSKWTERLRHYLQVAADDARELPNKARELAGDFRTYLVRFPERVSGAPEPSQHSAAPPSEDAMIEEAQVHLARLGYYTGPVDGTMGAEMVRALRDFQASQHLIPDFELAAQTRSRLRSVAAAAASPSAQSSTPTDDAAEPPASPPAETDTASVSFRQSVAPPAEVVEQSWAPQAKGAAPAAEAPPPTRPPADTPAQSASTQQAQSSAPAEAASSKLDLDGAYALLRRALGVPGRWMRDEEIRKWMEEAEPRFDFKDLGFSRFSRFLATARQVEVIELRKLPDGHSEAALPAGKGEPSGGISISPEPQPQPDEPPFTDEGRAAMEFAIRLGAGEAGASVPFSVRLLAGILSARPPHEGESTARFLAEYLASLRSDVALDPLDVAGLADLGITTVPGEPEAEPASTDPLGLSERLAIQERALELVLRVVGEHIATRPPVLVSTRHLFAVLIAPDGSPLPSQLHLESLGARLDDLRWRFLRYVRTHAPAERQDIWRAFLLPAGPLPLGFAENAPAAAYDSDADGGRDRLNITPEVNALAAVLASQELDPPLAVGLFGDWGTGKSFFMRRMRTRIRDLARDARDGKAPGICPNIVQIPFNAWHYMDANLWASLVTGVFDGLANALRASADDSPAVVRERLLGKLAENHAVLVEAERRLAAADAAADRARTKLDNLATKKMGLREVLASGGDVVEAALAQPEVRGQLDRLADDVGLPKEALAQTPEALERLGTWRGKLRTAWRVITGQAGDRSRLLATAAFAVLIVAVAAAIWWAAGTEFAGKAAAFAAAALGLAAQYWAQLRPVLQKLREAQPRVNAIMDSARKAADASAARLQAKKDDAEKELAGIEQEEAAARQAQADAVRRRQEIEEEIAEIQAGRRLHRFISERSAAEDYRRHLGLVALIRNDFQHLSTLLRDARRDRGGLPPVDRIILYIDDLDRCPEKRVVEVLQAVHLLLAFKLFVVVVGVDSRWLLRSVQSHYSQLRADRESVPGRDEEEDDDEATPQNYLEKIFQIPFTLRPMDSGGFRDLIGSLIRVPGDAAEEEEPEEDDEEWIDPLPAPPPAAAAPEPTAASSVDAPLPDAASGGPGVDAASGAPAAEAGAALVPPPDVAVAMAAEDASAGEEGSAPEPESDADAGVAVTVDDPRHAVGRIVVETVAPDGAAAGDDAGAAGEEVDAQAVQQALVIEEPERAFLQRLSPLIPSPRSAKRLVNVYRFIRASLTPDVLAQFRGGGGLPGEYQAVALLLAALTGFPTQAAELFRALNAAGAQGTSWWEFCDTVQRGEVDPARWEQFRSALAQVRREVELDDALEPFVRWAPHVARFSFQTGQIFARRHG